jgi:hypothetical protein
VMRKICLWKKTRSNTTDGASLLRSGQGYRGVTGHGSIGRSLIAAMYRDKEIGPVLRNNHPFFHDDLERRGNTSGPVAVYDIPHNANRSLVKLMLRIWLNRCWLKHTKVCVAYFSKSVKRRNDVMDGVSDEDRNVMLALSEELSEVDLQHGRQIYLPKYFSPTRWIGLYQVAASLILAYFALWALKKSMITTGWGPKSGRIAHAGDDGTRSTEVGTDDDSDVDSDEDDYSDDKIRPSNLSSLDKFNQVGKSDAAKALQSHLLNSQYGITQTMVGMSAGMLGLLAIYKTLIERSQYRNMPIGPYMARQVDIMHRNIRRAFVEGDPLMPSCRVRQHLDVDDPTESCIEAHNNEHRLFPPAYGAWRKENLTEPEANVELVQAMDSTMKENAEALLDDFSYRLKDAGTGVDAGAKADNPMKVSLWDLLLALELADPTSDRYVSWQNRRYAGMHVPQQTWNAVKFLCQRFEVRSTHHLLY